MFAAAGTGGHFYPALALGAELVSRGSQAVYLLKSDRQAAAVLDSLKMPYICLPFAARPCGFNPLKWAAFAFKFAFILFRILLILKKYRPDVCIGTGGYASFPLVFAARFAGFKTVVHESNAVLGFANRLSAKFVDLVLLGLPVKNAPANAKLCGTAVRGEFCSLPTAARENAQGVKEVLIFGGSQGARNLNFAAAGAVKQLAASLENKVRFTHITGERDYEDIKKFYSGKQADIIPYARDICAFMKRASLVLARSGASSLAELIALKKPSVLTPLPFSADNHQLCNAKVLSGGGCAVIIEESSSLEEDLKRTLEEFIKSPEKLKKMSESFNGLNLPAPQNAAKLGADIIETLALKAK